MCDVRCAMCDVQCGAWPNSPGYGDRQLEAAFTDRDGCRIYALHFGAMDPRLGATLGRVNEALELTYLRAGSEPPWERPHRNGVDITDRPDLQTVYERQRRQEHEWRVDDYRRRGLIGASHGVDGL